MSSVAVDRFDLVGMIFKIDNVALQQKFNRIPLLSISNLGQSLENMSQLFPMNIWLIKIRNPAIRRVSVRWRFQTLSTNFNLQTLHVVKSTVSSSNISSRWCQSLYRTVPPFAISRLFKQFFISLSSVMKKILELLEKKT